MKFKEMNVPNKLTTIRMFLVPVVIVLLGISLCGIDYFLFDKISILRAIALLVFVGASITDFIDGYIARRDKLITDYGKLMDPLADKLLVNSSLVLSMIIAIKENIENGPIFILIAITSVLIVLSIARDTFVDALRMQALRANAVVPANIFGKLKTATLMIGEVIMLIPLNHPIIFIVGASVLCLGSIFSIIGGVIYWNQLKGYLE